MKKYKVSQRSGTKLTKIHGLGSGLGLGFGVNGLVSGMQVGKHPVKLMFRTNKICIRGVSPLKQNSRKKGTLIIWSLLGNPKP